MKLYYIFFILAILCALLSSQIDKRIKIHTDKKIFIALSVISLILTIILVITK